MVSSHAEYIASLMETFQRIHCIADSPFKHKRCPELSDRENNMGKHGQRRVRGCSSKLTPEAKTPKDFLVFCKNMRPSKTVKLSTQHKAKSAEVYYR